MAFNNCVTKLLISTKQVRTNIQTPVDFIATWVRGLDEDVCKNLKRVLTYLNGTIHLPLTLQSDFLTIVNWWVDASLVVHPDM